MGRFSILVAAMAAIAPAMAHPTNAPRQETAFGCGVEPSAEFLAIAEDIAVAEGNGTLSSVRAAAFNVQTYIHVVSASASEAITQSQVNRQITEMNANFADAGVTFTLAGTDFTINRGWSTDSAELAMKKALRKGDYAALNLYFLTDLGGPLGYCYFPTNAAAGSDTFYTDGCTILSSTAPGGSETNFNLGRTATHEVGHWLGLLHTFQGGCSGSGDSVADTPAQASYSTGCPVGRDSCPNAAGLDPITNYMDYSYDSCYEEFSAGQITRINSFWQTYRA